MTNVEQAQRTFDRVLDFIADRAPVILDAHLSLGVPLDELISAAARRAMNQKLITADKQLVLPIAKESDT